jgi:DNA-3-methyladenine glycosylase
MKRFTPLPRSFYEPSARVVAPQLLGHWLIRSTPEGVCGGVIVETEAYLADDPACHGARGMTPRNRVMFGEPGCAYVYLIYGFYHCVNAVCRPSGVAEAVLIRAIEPVFGAEFMQQRRPVRKSRELTSGPGKLCAAMGIDRTLDGANLLATDSPLFIARNPEVDALLRKHGPAATTTRIGIKEAVDEPLRFVLPGSDFVSRKVAALLDRIPKA